MAEYTPPPFSMPRVSVCVCVHVLSVITLISILMCVPLRYSDCMMTALCKSTWNDIHT